MRFFELSHVIGHGTVTYPGMPPFSVSDYLSREASKGRYAEGTTFHIARVDMVANTGTYIDSPNHRFENGADLAGLSLEQTASLDGLCLDARRAGRAIDESLFAGHELHGRAVLVQTGWARHFGTEAYGEGHPFLTRSAGECLVRAGVALVGIDSLNIDDTAALDRPAHTVLLGANIPIVEHLTGLEQLPTAGFRFFAVAPRLRGVGSFPVRAFAMVA